MLAELLTKIQQDTKPEILRVDEIDYCSHKLNVVQPNLPVATALSTLGGLVDFTLEMEDLQANKVFVNINAVDNVALMSRALDRWNRRTCHAQVTPVPSDNDEFKLRFGQYYSPEDFIIRLQTTFQMIDSDDLQYVLRLASGLRNEMVSAADDDGLSQKVAVSKGVALRVPEVVKRTVKLTPWRIFREAKQPESTFLFRLRAGSPEKPPDSALFLADGDSWKVQAVANIKTFLERELGAEYVILA